MTYSDVVGNSYPRLQLVTIEELLSGSKPSVPLVIPPYTEALPVQEVMDEMTLF